MRDHAFETGAAPDFASDRKRHAFKPIGVRISVGEEENLAITLAGRQQDRGPSNVADPRQVEEVACGAVDRSGVGAKVDFARAVDDRHAVLHLRHQSRTAFAIDVGGEGADRSGIAVETVVGDLGETARRSERSGSACRGHETASVEHQ